MYTNFYGGDRVGTFDVSLTFSVMTQVFWIFFFNTFTYILEY